MSEVTIPEVIKPKVTYTENERGFVAKIGDEEVGQITTIERPDKDLVVIYDLGVKSKYREKGIGTTLVRKAVEKAIREGYGKIGAIAVPDTIRIMKKISEIIKRKFVNEFPSVAILLNVEVKEEEQEKQE
jgi:predicted GNAT family acetyltransferase